MRPPKSVTEIERESGTPAAISSAPTSTEVATSLRRRTISGEVPSPWLDRLLVATAELPVSDGEEAVVRAMLKAIAEIVPHFGVGACLVTPDEPRKSAPQIREGTLAEQRVWKLTPQGEDHRAVGMDPTRLFPGYAYECSLEAEPNGTTLHLAGDDPAIDNEDSPIRHALGRAAQGMGRGLVFARSHEKAMTDAQNLRALNNHMVQAEKLASLGQIAAGVVHELNNPLTSIVAYTDVLVRKMTQENGDAGDLEKLRRISESATRMLRFTRDLVTYSRPSQQTPVPVRVGIVIERALAFCEHVLSEANVTVERKLDPSVPEISGMPEQLAQVFVNLITNACHAMPAQDGKLVVATHVEGLRVIVTLKDNGHGIAPENLARIFAPFFTTKTEGRGTGLGLSIVKNIIEQHNGEIWAEPAEGGVGTSFVIALRAAT